MTILVRPMTPADAGAVLAIYQAGIDTGNATFETTAPTRAAFDAGGSPATAMSRSTEPRSSPAA